MAVRLDPVDWRILKELQADGSMTNVALAYHHRGVRREEPSSQQV